MRRLETRDNRESSGEGSAWEALILGAWEGAVGKRVTGEEDSKSGWGIGRCPQGQAGLEERLLNWSGGGHW